MKNIIKTKENHIKIHEFNRKNQMTMKILTLLIKINHD
jgi:hypothetical protein